MKRRGVSRSFLVVGAGISDVPQPAAGASTRNFDHGIFAMS